SSGTVHIGKTNISMLSEDQLASFRQRNIGFVFQSYNLLPQMTAAENVAMPLLFRGTDRTLREREAAQMLKKVGLANRMRHKPSEMSGGQQQRVGIARAFVAKPKIVFADEPTGNLDSRTTLEVMRLLIEMSHEHGITFVLVTHDNELARYADRIVTIRDGEVLSDRKNDRPAYLDPIPARSEADGGEPEPAAPVPQQPADTPEPPPAQQAEPSVPAPAAPSPAEKKKRFALAALLRREKPPAPPSEPPTEEVQTAAPEGIEAGETPKPPENETTTPPLDGGQR
ncbi:MAG: ABC transporter ATP-binding protein, partial [Oscillospiraceae bacterium]